MKINSKLMVTAATLIACIGSVSVAQMAENGSRRPANKSTPMTQPVPTTPIAPKLEGGKEGLATAAADALYTGQDPLPNIGEAPATPIPPVSIPAVDEAAAKGNLTEGSMLNANGNLPAAIIAWSKAYSLAPATDEGRKIAREAAKRLGFAAVENRNARMAESYWAAEAILARKLYFAGVINARAFSESLGHWASGAGSMGRSAESSAFVFYAAEVRARAQAAQSAQILNRESNFKADKVENIRVDAGGLCVTGNIDILKTHVSCDDERSMRSDAVSLQTRQITADAPPPPTKAEREAAEAKKKKNGEE